MQKVKVFNELIEFDGYQLPVEFAYISKSFLNDLSSLDFFERIKTVFKYLTDKELESTAFNDVKDSESPALVYSFDDAASCLDLSDGKTCCYMDYIFDKTNAFFKICSLISVFTCAYVDLIDGGVIDPFEKINFAISDTNEYLLLSLLIAKRIGLPIDFVIYGGEKPLNTICEGLYSSQVFPSDVDDMVFSFYEEYGYALDLETVKGVVALNNYYTDYDDGHLTLIVSVASPYLFARRILKNICDLSEISVDKAIKRLYEETALEIPNPIKTQKINPFFNENQANLSENFIKIIKTITKV